jgi:hypothetical protein
MRILFSIEFTYKEKKYSGIVRVIHKEDCTEFHVRVMNARLDRWLFGRHVYLLQGQTLIADDTMCAERVSAVRSAVYYSLQDYLRKQWTGQGLQQA